MHECVCFCVYKYKHKVLFWKLSWLIVWQPQIESSQVQVNLKTNSKLKLRDQMQSFELTVVQNLTLNLCKNYTIEMYCGYRFEVWFESSQTCMYFMKRWHLPHRDSGFPVAAIGENDTSINSSIPVKKQY